MKCLRKCRVLNTFHGSDVEYRPKRRLVLITVSQFHEVFTPPNLHWSELGGKYLTISFYGRYFCVHGTRKYFC